MTLLEELKRLLKEDTRLVDSEGNLLKNRIVELALKLDKDLIKLLLKNDRIKNHFFDDVDGVLVFDKEKFMKFIDNKEFLPNSYTAFKNKIGLANEEGKYLAKSKEIVLVWPYKDCVLEGGQEEPDEKRKEIFHNVILAPDEIDRLLEPKVFTNFKRIDKDGEHLLDGFRRDAEINRERGLPENTITDNLIIKGNNLLVLHSLLEEFRGKVKLIYIDPPYNTGNDEFKYNDSFRHSTWLTFMKNRLEVAKELLREDGVIFVQIDFRELAYLKVLMDEIFGRENFIGQINWQRVPEGRTLLGQGESDLKVATEYILVYAKQKKPGILRKDIKKKIDCTEKIIKQYSYILKIRSDPVEFKRIKDSNGNEIIFYKIENFELVSLKNKNLDNFIENYENMVQSVGIQEESTLQQKILSITKKVNTLCMVEYIPTKGKRKGMKVKDFFLKDRKLIFAKDFSTLDLKSRRLYREVDINDFWSNDEIQVTDIANEGGVSLRRGKKPEALMHRIISWATQERDIVLDFFMGTGTTCAVAHKMGRQYIGVEQLDYGENSAVVRLKNVIDGDQTGISKEVGWRGGGDFVYMELMKLNEAFIEKIRDAKSTQEILSIWEDMKHNGFLSYRVDSRLFDENMEEFKSLSLEEQKKLLLEMLDYNDLYVNYSEIDDAIYNVNEKDKKLNKEFYEGGKKNAREPKTKSGI